MIDNVLRGMVQLVFISPECLLHNRMYRSMLLSDAYKQNLVVFAVDEAHCVKTWYVCKISGLLDTKLHSFFLFRGDEFRPAFAETGEVRSIVPDSIPVLALTATTTYTILQAVVSRLSLRVKEMIVVAISPQRCNIT